MINQHSRHRTLVMKRIVQSVILVGGLIAVYHDGNHYAVPVAFFWCFLFLWQKMWQGGKSVIVGYITTIENTLQSAQNKVDQAQDFLDTVHSSLQTLQTSQEDVIRLAHQEAAHILLEGQKEQEILVKNYRQSLAFGMEVIHRQAYEQVMGALISDIKQAVADNSVDQWPLVQSRWKNTPSR